MKLPVPATSHQTVPPIDVEVLFSRCMGNVSFALALLDELEISGNRLLEEIVLHTESDAVQEAAEAAHSLKGATAIIGAESVRELSAKIEAAGRAGESSLLLDMVHELRAEMDRCLTYIPTLRTDLQRRSSPAR
ncbi:MAG: Hpt domain-containing protein [Pirellulaceae bacterium]|nr:Hpt domain-containing protein [Pirellulaceae bacterium]